MQSDTIDRYLERIGLTRADVTVDPDGLALLQHAHLAHVPFENLDIVFGGGVSHDRSAAVDKIVDRHRGGWCFEANGAFSVLLDALGFDVVLLGAAVLLDGPSTVIDHLALEVSGGPTAMSPRLADVGFGDSGVRPIELNRRGPQDAGDRIVELIPSPQGTTATEHVDGIPAATMRFKRVAHRFDDFAGVAASLQSDPAGHWASKPFATRLIDTATHDRVTLTTDRLTLVRNGSETRHDVARDEWDALLGEWFGIERPGPWPA